MAAIKEVLKKAAKDTASHDDVTLDNIDTVSLEKFERFIVRSKARCQDVVNFDGEKIGELQPIPCDGYKVAGRCNMHTTCSRMRGWKVDEPVANVEWILVRWMLKGCRYPGVAQADQHKDPKNCARE